MNRIEAEPGMKQWQPAEILSVVWIGTALLLLVPITNYLQGSFPIFTVLWLVVPLVMVVRAVDAGRIGFRSVPWKTFFGVTAANLGLLLALAAVVEPWSHAYQELVSKALASQVPDTTFAWLIRFTGLKAWLGLILFSGLVTIFAEELFFRGWLLQAFMRRMGTTLSIIIQAALFALPQSLAALLLSPLQGGVYAVIYSFLGVGVIGGWAAARTRSIWPSLVSATLWNAILVALLVRPGGGL